MKLERITMLKMTILLVATSLLTPSAYSHEGDHDVPGNVQAPKGGLIRSTEDGHFELLRKYDPKAKKDQLSLYFYSLENLKAPKGTEGIELETTLTLPGKKKPEALSFVPEGDHWSASVDVKTIHRYTLNISPRVNGNRHKIKYTLEPKR